MPWILVSWNNIIVNATFLPICISLKWICHVSRNIHPKLIVLRNEYHSSSWFSGFLPPVHDCINKKARFQHTPGKTTWNKKQTKQALHSSFTLVIGPNTVEHPPLADRTSFLHIALLDKTWKVTYFSKIHKTVHKELTQNVDSSSFSGLSGVFSNHNTTKFSGNSIVDSHSQPPSTSAVAAASGVSWWNSDTLWLWTKRLAWTWLHPPQPNGSHTRTWK